MVYHLNDTNLDELVDSLSELSGSHTVIVTPVKLQLGGIPWSTREKPLAPDLLKRALKSNSLVRARVAIPFSSLVEAMNFYDGGNEFLNNLSAMVTGSIGGLIDFSYKPIAVHGSDVVLLVEGKVSEYIEEMFIA